MTLREILEHRRAVRKYDSQQKLDDERVRECLRLATLAPTSSNLQLWEAWHVTSEDTLKALATEVHGRHSRLRYLLHGRINTVSMPARC